MKHLPHPSIAKYMLGIGFAAVLAACGGGGSSAPAPAPAPVATTPAPPPDPNASLNTAANDFGVNPADFTGDAAGGDGGAGGAGGSAGDGAPIKRATVVMVDKNGLQKVGQTDDNGNYLINTRTAMKAPIVLKVIDTDGKVLTSVINEDISAGVFKRVMINPLTDKIVSDVLASDVPGTDKALDGSKIDTSKLAKATADLRTSVQSSLAAVGLTNTAAFNPIADKYAYDGKGVDAVIDSISHTRNPATGQTELRSKLGSTSTDSNGVVQAVLVTAATPLATTQVIALNPGELTYDKLNNFVVEVNYCLSLPNTANDARCNDNAAASNARFFQSSDYKHSGKDWDEDFITLTSNADRSYIQGSTFRNPVILYIGKYTNSTATFNDLAVVEFTVRQPGTGSRVGTSTTPVEYTKVVVFKRDDTQTKAKAGNWIAHGNQRFFDWTVQSQYTTVVQKNPARDTPTGVPSAARSSIRLGFTTTRFDYANRAVARRYVASDVFAIRLKGPGLPNTGVVFTPNAGNSGSFTIFNKTGVIPSPGTVSPRANNDFRLGMVYYPSGNAVSSANWPGSNGNVTFSDAPADFSTLLANNRYQAEFFTNANPSTPIVEGTLNLAALENPSNYAKRILHDLSPSLPLITPPAATVTTSITAAWTRVTGGQRIESAYACSQDANLVNTCIAANLSDAFSLAPSSTLATITLPTAFPALGTVTNTSREVGLVGVAARARLNQNIIYYN